MIDGHPPPFTGLQICPPPPLKAEEAVGRAKMGKEVKEAVTEGRG
jgi:hypothetical protein